MSKVYKCDSCNKMIAEPYEKKMKEFYLGTEYEEYGMFPVPSKRKVKIHLCDDCFKGLKEIGKRVKEERKNND